MKKVLSIILSLVMLLSTLPMTVISSSALTDGTFNYELNSDNTITITSLIDKSKTSVNIPSTISGLNVSKIGSSAFSGCSSLKTISIGNGISLIGSSAFRNCISLTSVSLPSSVKIIEGWAFSNCTSVTSLSLNSGLTTIGNSAFDSMQSLKSISVPDTVTSLGAGAFGSCKSLTSIKLSNNIERIEYNTFKNCTSLNSISIPDKVKSIGISAFENTAYFNNTNNWKDGLLYVDNCLVANKNDSGTVIINDNARLIADSVFAERTKISFVFIGSNVKSIGESAFKNCIAITNMFIPGNVERIYPNAFFGCTGIKTLTLNKGLKEIGDNTFNSCLQLTDVDLPETVTTIGKSAFQDCAQLTNINIPNSVTSIGSSAFQGCAALTSVSIPDSVISIGAAVFQGCAALNNLTLLYNPKCNYDNIRDKVTKVIIPDNVTNIGGFSDWSSLKSVSIGNSVTSIGAGAFEYCTSLTSVTIPNSVTSMGDSAFMGCTSLTSVTIPDSVTYIAWGAFYGCASLTSVTIPSSVTRMERDVFGRCGNQLIIYGYTNTEIENYAKKNNIKFVSLGDAPLVYKYIKTSDNTAEITGFYGKYTNEPIPSVIDGLTVTSIGSSAFANCTSLTSVTIPDSVTSIGNSAFANCTSLTSVTIPDSVTSIGNSVFANCTSLTNVTIPGTVKYIDSTAFDNCTSLNHVTLVYNPECNYSSIKDKVVKVIVPDNVTSIKDSAFSGWTSVSTVTIGNNVTSIGYYAFYDCASLKSITIPDSVTSIRDHAFESCTSLTSITLPDGIEDIFGQTFFHCHSLTSINIPESVEKIWYNAFRDCISLKSITIPARVNYIYNSYVFIGCKSLTDINVDKNNSSYSSVDGVLFNKDKTVLIKYPEGKTVKQYSMPDSVTSIGDYSFYDCSSLQKVNIPKGVKKFGNEIFTGSGLKTIYGYKGSAAENYAKAIKKTFVPMDDYPDVSKNAWYYDAVEYVKLNGYMSGYSNGNFGPGDDLKRQDFVVILANVSGADLDKYAAMTPKLKDVKKGTYYAAAVNWAVENNIIAGYANGKFGVGDNITREQVATILYRYMGSPTVNNQNATLKKFKDANKISSFAKTPVAWAIQNNVISGMADGRIAPTEGASRAQIAAIIMRMDKQGMFNN